MPAAGATFKDGCSAAMRPVAEAAGLRQPRHGQQSGRGQVATVTDEAERSGKAPRPWAPDRYEQVLAVAAVVLLGFVVAAIIRGRAHWHDVGPAIWLHLATIMVALALTPVMLLRLRGDGRHSALGWIWSVSLVLTALISFFVRNTQHGGFSFIHILSVLTLIQVPLIVRAARTHDVRRHRRLVRGMVTGALLIAGFFTFPFGRMLGSWLFA